MRRHSPIAWRAVLLLASTITACAPGNAHRTGLPVMREQEDARLLEARTAFEEATKLKDAGRLAEALARAERSLALRESALDGMHPDVASALHLVGALHQKRRDLVRAEPFFQRALAIREVALGDQHPDFATSLHCLAIVYADKALYGQSEPLLRRALALREAALGAHHPDVAHSLNGLAATYMDQGLYGQAEPLLLRALAIRRAALGNHHHDFAQSLFNLALAYHFQGLSNQAESLLRREIAIAEASLGKDNPTLAEMLEGLAFIHWNRDLYGQAASLYERVLAIRQAAFGEDHPDVTRVLLYLARLDHMRGLYSQAASRYQRVLAIHEATLGAHHPDVAATLNNLAATYMEQGLYGQAQPLLQRALAIREAAFGERHPGVTQALFNLALIHQERGSYGQAESLMRRVLALDEVILRADDPRFATTLNGLAGIYEDQGRYQEAEPLFQRALAIREAALGKLDPLIAETLNQLAAVHLDQGRYDRAEPLLQRALALQETALGEHHPNLAPTLNHLARPLLARGRLASALPLLTRAFTISERRLRQEALDFSESRLAVFLQHLRTDEQALYALLSAHLGDARARHLALSATLLLKGRSVEETANISRTLSRSLGTGDRALLERLRELRTQLATLSLEGPGALTPADYPRRLQALADEGDTLEAELARRSAPLRALTALPSPTEIVSRVAASLPRDGALVEFIVHEDRPLLPTPGGNVSERPRPSRYLALVLLPDATTRAVDLGPAEPIDRAASSLRTALARRDASFQAAARRLHQLAFLPLRPLLGTTRRLFLSPDGQLSLVPFAALHDGRGFLLDTFDFVYLTSGRQLLPQDRPEDAVSVTVLADPDFTAAPRVTAADASATHPRGGTSASLERFFSSVRAVLPAQAWTSLPGTRREAESIQRLLPQARLFLGPEATKERLLHLRAPGILHLATHGFFLEDAPVPAGVRAVVQPVTLGDPSPAMLPQDPLLRSGLALAGARPATPDAALVSALELAGLELWGTQLVVLSACDTGRGDVQLGQGVSGLRRALMVAGAETVVMSLWKVDDDSTRLLMESYYRDLLAGQGRASALREAMRALRVTHPHPHDWAPFIALGSDAPLRGITPSAPETPAP